MIIQQLTKLSIMIKNIIYNELKISITKNRAKITSSTILFIFLIVLSVENFLTTIVIAAQQQQHKQSIIPSSAIINGSVEFSPITNRTSESIVSNAKNSSTTSSPSTRVNNFATKIGTLLKILQIVNHVASISSTARESLIRNHPVENRNDSQSETRSMSTWFGFTKKTPASTIRRSNHQHHHQQSQHSFNDQATNMQTAMHRPTFIPISQPSLPPPHHPSFQSFDSPNPFLLIPPLSDTSAIDYWLKLLEDPKFEEQIMPILWSGRNHHRYHNRKPFDYDDKFLSNSHLNNNPWMGKKNRKFKINSRNSEQSKSNLSNKRKYNQGNKDEDDNGDHYEYDPNGYPDKWSLQNDIENGSDFDNIMMLTPNVRPNQRDKKPKPYMLDNFNQQQQQQQQLQNQQQQQYDTTPRCDKFTEDICIDDFEYPEHAILDEIYKRKDIFQLMYAEVNGEVPLVDGITKDMDENFSQDYYYNNNDPEDPDDDYHDDFNGPQTSKRHHSSTNKSTSLDFDESNNHHQNSHNKNSIEHGFVCRTEVLYAKPKLAKNLKRKWRVIVNAGDFTQTIRLEKCNKANSECRYIADHKYASRCAQIHSIHRLLVFEKGKGFFIDSFRIPTACACHVYSVKQTNSNPNESKINDLRTKISIGDSMESNKSLWSMLSNNNNNNNNPVQSYDDDNGNNNHHLNNDGNNRAQSSKLYYHSHSNQNQVTKQMQQQLKQALNLLNNKEFFKLLPQLTSIDATTSMNSKWDDNNDDNVLLQKLLENLATTSSTTGKVPSNFLLTTTTKPNNNKNNHYMNDNNHHMNRFTIIPDYQFNLSDMNEGNKADDDLLTNAEHNFGMTTNPNQRNKQHISTTFGSISGHQPTSAQAPVVQVIHMPVSTNGLDIPATVNRLAHWPYQFDQHDDQHSSTSLSLLMPSSSSQSQSPSQSSLSKYLASASDSHYFQQQQQKSKINNDTLAYNNMTLTTIQTNNHTISDILNDNNTTMAIVNEDVNHRHDDDDDETRKDVHDNDNNSDDDNTKINFSYHPILDYIVN